jgi:hypothetical protein
MDCPGYSWFRLQGTATARLVRRTSPYRIPVRRRPELGFSSHEDFALARGELGELLHGAGFGDATVVETAGPPRIVEAERSSC